MVSFDFSIFIDNDSFKEQFQVAIIFLSFEFFDYFIGLQEIDRSKFK